MTDKPTPTDAELQSIIDDADAGPPTDKEWLCLECGRWTPWRHEEAHDHADGCKAPAIYAAKRDWKTRLKDYMAKWGQPAQATKCECTMAQRCTGSGCRYCNPQEYIDMLHEQIADAGTAQAAEPVALDPLTPERVKEIVRGAGYDQCGIPYTERAAFINGLRHGEQAHGIKGGQHGTE